MAALAIAALSNKVPATEKTTLGSGKIKHVLLLSIDGMHAVDFYNCSHGIAGANNGSPYCPNLTDLSQHAKKARQLWLKSTRSSRHGVDSNVTAALPQPLVSWIAFS
jgi:hypothetical protein